MERKPSFDDEPKDEEEYYEGATSDPTANFTDADGNEYLQDLSPEDDASLLVSFSHSPLLQGQSAPL